MNPVKPELVLFAKGKQFRSSGADGTIAMSRPVTAADAESSPVPVGVRAFATDDGAERASAAVARATADQVRFMALRSAAQPFLLAGLRPSSTGAQPGAPD